MEIRVAQNTAEWMEQRKTRLTASRFGVICTLSKYASPRSLFELLVGRMIGEEKGETEATIHGHQTEGLAQKLYEKEQGRVILSGHFWVHKDYPWLGASPDGIVCDPELAKNPPKMPSCCAIGLWENKSPIHRVRDAIPRDYMAQMQGQLEIVRQYGDSSLHYDWCDYTEYFEGQILRIWRVYRSQDYWNWMLPRLAQFHDAIVTKPDNLVLNDIGNPPDVHVETIKYVS